MADYTILLIDYEPRSIESARAPLVAVGYKVEIANDGLAGLEAFERIRPDLVIVEAMLPKKNGFEVCQTIKKSSHGQRVPVLITTAVYKGRKYRTQALHVYGCDEYLEKPIAAGQLVETCRRFLKDDKSGAGVPLSPVKTATGPVASAAPDFPVAPAPKAGGPVTTPLKPTGPRASSAPSASFAASIISDLTEEEIMARLDAILPDETRKMPIWGGTAVPELEPLPSAQVEFHEAEPAAAADAPLEASTLEAAACAEPTSESDANGTAPESAPTPFPADGTTEDRDPQIVRFDASRSRKRARPRRSASNGGATSTAVSTSSTVAIQESPPEQPDRRNVHLPAVASQVEIPSEVETGRVPAVAETTRIPFDTPKRSGAPQWIWAAAVSVIAAGALYLFFGSSGKSTSTSRAPSPQKASVSSAIPEATGVETAPRARGTISDTAARPSAAGPRRDITRSTQTVPSRKSATTKVAAMPPKPVPPPTVASKPSPVPVQVATRPAEPSVKVAEASSTAAGHPLGTPNPGPLAVENKVETPAPSVPAVAPSTAVQPPAAADAAPSKPPTTASAEAQAAALSPPTGRAEEQKPGRVVSRGELANYDELDSPPASLHRALPAYTSRARELRQQGSIFLNVLVDENGKVKDVQVIQGIPDSDLNTAAENAARAWRYAPPTQGGVPVKVWKFEKINFAL